MFDLQKNMFSNTNVVDGYGLFQNDNNNQEFYNNLFKKPNEKNVRLAQLTKVKKDKLNKDQALIKIIVCVLITLILTHG
jgi:hypothetical protein